MEMQLGKAGVTPEFINALRTSFKRHENVKIALLKSSRERDFARETAQKICAELETAKEKFNYSIIGFAIFIKKVKKK